MSSYTTGGEARALAREGFEGAVIDVRLGGEIGLDLLPHLRATSAPPRIVVMPGQVTPGLLARASAAGAAARLAKPFDVDQLLATLMPEGPLNRSPMCPLAFLSGSPRSSARAA